MKKLVIIPTYNEASNIAAILQAILAQKIEIDILVVDDNSPDGTAKIVHDMRDENSQLFILERAGKEGLGKAYIAGFKWAIENKYDVVVQMDADFSHRPEDLKNMVLSLNDQDVIVGSRYVKGGGTQNWSFLRQCISRFGSWYARSILGYPLHDWTGGFNLWKVDVLKFRLQLDQVRSEGYSFQIEMKYRALQAGCKVSEFPILFEERRNGQSKMSFKIIWEAFFRVWKIRSRL